MNQSEIKLTQHDIETIKHYISTKLLVSENVDHSTFQVLATLRALRMLLNEKRIEPQFEIDEDSFKRIRKSNLSTEL